MNIVTQGNWSVSCTTGDGIQGAILSVLLPKIAGRDLPVDKRLRGFGHGRTFASSEAAFQFALEHGYLQQYFTAPELRAQRKESAKKQRFAVVSGSGPYGGYDHSHGDFATHALAKEHLVSLAADATLRVIRTAVAKAPTQHNLFS